MSHLERLVFVQLMLGDQTGQVSAVHAPGHIMACWNRQKGTRVMARQVLIAMTRGDTPSRFHKDRKGERET